MSNGGTDKKMDMEQAEENTTDVFPQAAEVPDTEEESASQGGAKEKKKRIAVFGLVFSKKQVCTASIGLLCAIAIVGGVWVSNSAENNAVNAVVTEASQDMSKSDLEENIKKNPNADTEAVEKETEAAQETAKKEESTAKTPETSSGKSDSGSNTSTSKKDTSGSSQTSSSSNGGSSSKTESKGNTSGNSGSSSKKEESAHQHNWVAQTKTVHHDAQYKTVHHDAVTHQVWHDAVTEERYICNQCGQDITSDPDSHFKNSLLNGGSCGGYHTSYNTIKEGYYETITDQAAYDEQVQTSAAWDETVTTGYKCSTCGATK